METAKSTGDRSYPAVSQSVLNASLGVLFERTLVVCEIDELLQDFTVIVKVFISVSVPHCAGYGQTINPIF